VDALLAFVAALVALRLSGELVRRYRARRRPELAAWAGGLAAYAVAAGALAWGAAAGWSDAAFRVYYLGGALLTAALLGAGSLLLAGWRRVTPVALVYVGLAVGLALAVPLQGELSGSDIPQAQDVLDVWPARVLAILGNSVGTLAVVGVALATFRSRPVGNALILAGIAVAGIGSGLAGLGVGALAPAIAIAAVLLYAGFVAPASFAPPHPDQQRHHRERDRALDDRAGQAPMG
jgi:CHASE2 domain-containing sensor protein